MNVIAKIRQALGRLFVRPARYLSAEWERMAPRERRWVIGLAVAIVSVATALGAFLFYSTISELEEGNADIREALGAIAKHRDEYLDAKARAQAQEQRLGTDPPQLVADIEAAAREESLQIAESNERPSTTGKRWIEHDVDLKVRSADLQALANFMRRVETGTRPIFVTRLSLKRRFSEADKLDAELTATAFERIKEAAPGTKKKTAGGDTKDKSDAKGDAKTRTTVKETP